MPEGAQRRNIPLVQAFKELITQHRGGDINALSHRLAHLLLNYAIQAGASDIHFDPKPDAVLVRFRIDGLLHEQLSYPQTDFTIVPALRVAAGFAPRAAVSYTPEDGRFDVEVEGRNVQFRVSSFPSIYGDKLVLRLLDLGKEAITIDRLGVSADQLAKIRQLIQQPSGLFIVAGMTGCGKSTTLNCILSELSRPELNIMTLEDPVEYVLPRVTHSQINYKAGFGFAEGLRTLLRQDPDIVMLGEMRDAETAETAIRAALTGHLLFSTVHAASCVGVIHRLKGMNVEPFLLSSSLLGVLGQRLMRMLCPACSEPDEPNVRFLKILAAILEPDLARRATAILTQPGAKLRKPRGCPACGMSGYKRRVGIFELLTVDDDLRSVISGKETDIVTLRRAAAQAGMRPLLLDALDKAAAGITSQEEALRVAAEN